ncbi:MAG: alpha/beta hydrolase [Lentimonas sp.]
MQQAYTMNHVTIPLWPEDVPGESDPKAPSVIADKRNGNVTRITKVTDPALVVYEANPATKNGAAVVICPGGGYRILAIDKEGYEIASWLSDLGYTAFVLHYRVPKKQIGALQDAQRALRIVRGMHSKWEIETDKIGILGFSAGGSLSARASTRHTETLYDPIDDFDSLSARPDFSVLIYPAYLDQGSNLTLTPELKLTKETPPMFLFVAADDKYANSSLVMGCALRSTGLPFELHILPEGGHGFGMRSGNYAAETWPRLCEAWLQRTIFD